MRYLITIIFVRVLLLKFVIVILRAPLLQNIKDQVRFHCPFMLQTQHQDKMEMFRTSVNFEMKPFLHAHKILFFLPRYSILSRIPAAIGAASTGFHVKVFLKQIAFRKQIRTCATVP